MAAMEKREYRPLLAPGFRELTLPDLAPTFVAPFPASRRRPILLAGLQHFMNDLAATGVKCEVWIDGSFATCKPEPHDVDLLVVSKRGALSRIDKEWRDRFHQLIYDSSTSYHCDVYGVVSCEIVTMAYWRGWFGLMRDGRTPKGIGLISI